MKNILIKISKKKSLKDPLQLTVDEHSYIIDQEISSAIKIFKATGGAALLMNVKNGEVLSLVSLPNYNINKERIIDKNYINKITKGEELGLFLKPSQ